MKEVVEQFKAKFLDHEDDRIELIVQKGKDNSEEFSHLEVRSFDERLFLHMLEEGFKYCLITTHTSRGCQKITFVKLKESDELDQLFIKPNYFKNLDANAFFTEG